MILLTLGIVMFLSLLPVYLYDVSAWYEGGYRLSRKARKFWAGWCYLSVFFMSAGVWWLWINYLFGLVF